MIKKFIILSAVFFLLLMAFPTVYAFVAASPSTSVAYRTGLQAANSIGQGKDLIPEKLRTSQGFYGGVSVGYVAGEEGILQPNFIADDVQNIADMNALLSLNLQDLLRQSDAGRSDTLTSYVDELQTQRQKALNRSDILTSQINSLQSAYNSSNDQQNSLQTQVFSSIDGKLPYESEDAFQKFLAVKARTGDLFSRISILQRVQSKYVLAQQLFQNKINFVTANREALVKGVTVVNITDPDVKLIFTEQEWQNGISR